MFCDVDSLFRLVGRESFDDEDFIAAAHDDRRSDRNP
jgi:hypothetical protein